MREIGEEERGPLLKAKRKSLKLASQARKKAMLPQRWGDGERVKGRRVKRAMMGKREINLMMMPRLIVLEIRGEEGGVRSGGSGWGHRSESARRWTRAKEGASAAEVGAAEEVEAAAAETGANQLFYKSNNHNRLVLR
ncbi:hypothetical protein Scep_010341 [Stephania cephalantha]|uniref:Uncharacterized protein n=1 Tax=Stephania cephalantha TaxID=152367 RepID=A0AAP0JVV8_9MAGN